METQLKIWKTSRALYLSFFDLSLDQLNKIPQGFSNNLIWNIGHSIVVQQLLIYRASNQPVNISNNLINLYKTGTKPERIIIQTEVDELKELLISLISKTEEDYKKGVFTTYNELTLSTGFHIASFKDAVEFNNYHEGLHLGYMMALRKLI